MPGSMPATSQLEWLSSTTAMIVLFWSRATRDLLRSFGWGIAALHRLDTATKLPSLAARPIASIGPAAAKGSAGRCQSGRRHDQWNHLRSGREDRLGAPPMAVPFAAGPMVR